MGNSLFIGQLKQNNIQINNLKDSLSRTEKHMTDHEEALTTKVNEFMEKQNHELKSHTENTENPHQVTKKQVGLGNVDDIQQASKEEFDSHIKNNSNPHNVTATQIGLDKVINEKQATKVEFDLHTEDVVRHVTSTERNKWNSSESNAKAYTDTHENRKDNPHDVTKAQVGLDKVDNVQQASKLDFDQHSLDNIRHVTQADRNKWNGAQLVKLTDDSGSVSIISDPNVLVTSGFYEVSNSTAMPDKNFYKVLHLSSSANTASQIAVTNREGTIYTRVKISGAWSSWTRIITDGGTWQTPPLFNGWTQYTVSDSEHPLQFSKDSLGVVAVRGAIKGGLLGSTVTAFTLPEGFRPPYPFYHLGTASSSGAGGTPQFFRSVFNVDGTVFIQSCSNTENPNSFMSFSARFSTKGGLL
ncbi:pyocin knob domain-containing protein [Bacillus stercoris]|uniref:pyocin knob domain-containing protein n=1 Tax=Bacillus stercoris TaxID=2054641 RepID=UPI001FB21CE3|nr:pyocin knob domain-containing protein [Bacillus stercoris]